ncbi:uncharacterized protein PFLUO_LOCUS2846 [Penicillium psychrofluorescens]|uniref:uncharacterized protein n=1 Tax=Penicillium psychrofluorescens TaxID=3158075 RepID=UPI003CCDACDF
MPPNTLHKTYPWISPSNPSLASAPMLNIATANLAISVSKAGGIGFIAGGYNLSGLSAELISASKQTTSLHPTNPLPAFYTDTGLLPLGVGFLNWGADRAEAISILKQHPPAAVWLFAPTNMPDDLLEWANEIRSITPRSKTASKPQQRIQIWVQVGTVHEALSAQQTLHPDVIVAQGSDAGGHGLARSASLMTLLPEICSTLPELTQTPILAAGGISTGRSLAAALSLGAVGAVMGTRFLACAEANIATGYQREILRATDGGASTVRSTVYDSVRGIHGWPERYDGRGVVNHSYIDSVESGMDDEENRRLYRLEMAKGDDGWGPQGRMTTYAGTGVGLVNRVLSAEEILDEVWEDMKRAIGGLTAWQ